MGNILSNNGGNGNNNNDYRYPPASGLYFGNQFIMGGEQFPAMNPEAFLFGDMNDLNFLSRVPGSLPQLPQNLQHTNTIRTLVHIRKDTLKLVRHANSQDGGLDSHHIEFLFDSDTRCKITLMLFVKIKGASSSSSSSSSSSPSSSGDGTNNEFELGSKGFMTEPIVYEAGMGQLFSHSEQIITPSKYNDNDLFFNHTDRGDSIPLVIRIESLAPASRTGPHFNDTLVTFERGSNSGVYSIKPLIQRIRVNGVSYILKEIYGIEQQAANDNDDDGDDGDDDDSTECVVCMSDPRDTMVLPCRHLCLCNPCAEVLRFQANKCPICRAPFNSLLQIRIAKKIDPDATKEDDEESEDEEEAKQQADAPPGYALVPVAEALRPTKDDGYLDIAPDVQEFAGESASPRSSIIPKPTSLPRLSTDDAVEEITLDMMEPDDAGHIRATVVDPSDVGDATEDALANDVDFQLPGTPQTSRPSTAGSEAQLAHVTVSDMDVGNDPN